MKKNLVYHVIFVYNHYLDDIIDNFSHIINLCSWNYTFLNNLPEIEKGIKYIFRV